MAKTLGGIVVSTLVLFIWGFIYWGINPIPYESLQQSSNDEAAQQALREHFPESGTYLVPGTDHADDELAELFEAGPIATVHIIAEGGPVMDPAIMVGGFVLNLVFVALMAGFFRMAGAKEFGDFARLSVAIGVIAVVLIDIGDMIWWRETVSWKIWAVIYNFTAFLIVGHLLGIFMKESKGEIE